MSDGSEDKPIGYKQPPHYTRFQKGKSGNPKGRPKKPKAEAQPAPAGSSLLDDAFRGERDRMVRVSGSGGPQDIPMYHVVVKSMAARAAKGDVHAQKLLIQYWTELDRRDHAEDLANEKQQAKILKYIRELKQDQAIKWAEGNSDGNDPDDCWPHPDDIIIDDAAKTWRIRGPFDEKDVPFFEYYRAERDAMFIHAASLLGGKGSERHPLLVLWVFWDMQLPKRWQIYNRHEPLMMSYALMPLRKISALKDKYARRAQMMKPVSLSGPADKETYRVVNTALKPLLRRHGYRSLAEFEHDYQRLGDAMPWPKKSKGPYVEAS